MPADWRLPGDCADWALQERPDWTADDVRRSADKFRDYWTAKSGKDATKVDWAATWRNWVRNEHGWPNARASPRYSQAAEREHVSMILTGRGRHEQRIENYERDITGEAVRVA